MAKETLRSHDKAYVLVEARKLLYPKKSKKLRDKVRDLALEKKRRTNPF